MHHAGVGEGARLNVRVLSHIMSSAECGWLETTWSDVILAGVGRSHEILQEASEQVQGTPTRAGP